jgi:hypothetical protein
MPVKLETAFTAMKKRITLYRDLDYNHTLILKVFFEDFLKFLIFGNPRRRAMSTLAAGFVQIKLETAQRKISTFILLTFYLANKCINWFVRRGPVLWN